MVVNYAHSEAEARAVADRIARDHGADRVRVIRADVTKAAEVDRLIDRTVEAFAHLDILVNNAGGIVARSPIAEMSEELWDDVINLNLRSVFLCTRRAIPSMLARGWGRIINVTSIAARTGGNPGAGAYAAAKAGVSSLTRTMAKELATTGITVNGVAPGVIDTPFHQRNTPKPLFEKLVSTIPMARAGMPEDVSGAVLFLASDAAGYITGEIIEVNGGMLMD